MNANPQVMEFFRASFTPERSQALAAARHSDTPYNGKRIARVQLAPSELSSQVHFRQRLDRIGRRACGLRRQRGLGSDAAGGEALVNGGSRGALHGAYRSRLAAANAALRSIGLASATRRTR